MPGHLKIYLGYASHTGKTWRLLEEARRRKARGQDVVIGWLRKKDRPALSDMLAGLDVIPSRVVDGQPEMDLDAILKRKPYVVVIDELAHDNVPGSANAHRWQDVQELIAAGIGVVTAVNIQYLEALQSRIHKLLGRTRAETVPDSVLRDADEVVLVDALPDAMLQHPDSSASGLSERDLLALRELALLYTADAVEEEVEEYRQEHHIEKVWETQERILVCLTANPRGPYLIERGYQCATRWKGELWVAYVTADEHWSDLTPQDAERLRGFLDMARDRDAKVEVLENPDAAEAILSFARQQQITQIFIGHAAGYPFQGALSRTVAGRVILGAEGMDVHVVDDDPRKAPRKPSAGPMLPMALARLLSRAPRTEARGHMRVYLGYAPGVGKTFQMLLDGRYLRDHGQDVVVGSCDTCGRSDVEDQVGELEVIPLLDGGMDVDAILERTPQICLVDGLARQAAGKKRWEKVEALLEAGVHVFGTLDIAEVESLNDTVERITGVRVEETAPDWVVDDADEVILVDVAIRALLNRVNRGAVYPEGGVPASLQPLFTEGSLNALRELALRLVADRVEDELEALEQPKGAEAKEAVLACIHETPSAAALIRRARRTADRVDGPGYAVYVAPDEDWTGVPPERRGAVEKHLELARTLHLETHVLYGANVARSLVDFAIRHGVTQMLLGRSRKTGWREFFRRSVIEQVIRLTPWMDIQVVADR